MCPRVVQRATYISDLLSTHSLGELLDEGMTPEEQRDLMDAEAVCRRFLALDLRMDNENGVRKGARELLRETLGTM